MNTKWISVKDRETLPNADKKESFFSVDILMTIENKEDKSKRVAVGYLAYEQNEWVEYGSTLDEMERVTAWMPLPEPWNG